MLETLISLKWDLIIDLIIAVFFCEYFWRRGVKKNQISSEKGLLIFLGIIYCIVLIITHNVQFIVPASTCFFYILVLFPHRIQKIKSKESQEEQEG